MRVGAGEALLLTAAMGAAIFFCRVFPFVFFREKAEGNCAAKGGKAEMRKKRVEAFLGFVEKAAPPAAMTALAFNSLAGQIRANPGDLIPALAAGAFAALFHLWRRNPMISIFAGTALYMALIRAFGG